MWNSRLLGHLLFETTGGERDYPMMHVQTIFSKLEQWLRRKNSKEKVSDELFESVRVQFQEFKELVREPLMRPAGHGGML